MKTPDLILRCYVKKSGTQWVAVCIDLCLAAQADTQQQARKMLENQIFSYVEEALTIDRKFASELLSRKAPLYQRAEYLFALLAYKTHLAKKSIGQVFKTILPVHVGHNCHV